LAITSSKTYIHKELAPARIHGYQSDNSLGEASDDLLQAKSKVKKGVNDFVMTIAHLIPLQIT